MEPSTQFQLEVAIEDYLCQLEQHGHYTSDDILELRSHLHDETEALQLQQLDQEEAFLVSRKRLGNTVMLGKEYDKINGTRFYNRDLFIAVLSICTCLFLTFLYGSVTHILRMMSVLNHSSPVILGSVNYLFQFLFGVGVVMLVLYNKKYFSAVTKIFARSPGIFAVISVLVLVLMYFLYLYNSHMFTNQLLSNSAEREEHLADFVINQNIATTLSWLLPVTWLMATFYAFIQGYKQIRFVHYMVNETNYFTLFFIGIFCELVASSARSYTSLQDISGWITPTLFGIVWSIFVAIFYAALQVHPVKRLFCFLSFGMISEFLSGYLINASLRLGLPVSAYFLTMFVGSLLAILLVSGFRKKQMVGNVQIN